jgi:hypothetical protein
MRLATTTQSFFGSAEAEALVCQAEANQFLNLLDNNVGVSSGTPAGVKAGDLQKSHCSDYFKSGSTFRKKPVRKKSLGAGETKNQILATASGIGFGQLSGILRNP